MIKGGSQTDGVFHMYEALAWAGPFGPSPSTFASGALIVVPLLDVLARPLGCNLSAR
jgi:hypothetical protein